MALVRAHAHSLGHDPDDLLTFDLWRHIFGNPDTILADWLAYVNGALEGRFNRPCGYGAY